jgi:acyl carrier protein
MDELKTFIQNEVMNLAFKKVGFDESLVKSKLLDSIAVIDLLIAIEEKTGKIIPQHLVQEQNIDSIDKIVDTINSI